MVAHLSFSAIIACHSVWLTPALARPPAHGARRLSPATDGGVSPAWQQADPTPLRQGDVFESKITSTESRSFKITLTPGQYLRVLVEQYEIDLIVTLSDTDGKMLVEADSPSGVTGPEYVSTVAGQRGDYLLNIRATPGRVASGQYKVSVEELRPASASDGPRADAEKMLSEGRQLFAKGTKESRLAAIKKYDEALSYWKGDGDVHWQAVTLFSLGQFHRRLGEPDTAVKYFQEALALAPRLEAHDWRLIASALNDSGLAYAVLGEPVKAAEALDRALTMFQEKQDLRGQGSALNNLGFAYAKAGHAQDAVAYYEKAITFRRAESDRAGEANILNNIGGYFDSLGQPYTALDYYGRALSILKGMLEGGQLSDQERSVVNDRLASVFNNRAIDYDYLGEWQSALENYETALKYFHELGNSQSEAAALNNIGTLYSELGSPIEALESLEKSLKLNEEKVKDPNALSETLVNIGAIYVIQGKLSDASSYFSRALGLKTNDRRRAAALTNTGVVQMMRGDLRAAVASYDEAVKLERITADRRAEALTLLKRGEARGMMRDYGASLEDLGGALSLSKAIADPLVRASALRAAARVEREQGNLADALAHSGEALKIIEGLRTKVTSQQLRISYLATNQDYFETYIDICMQVYRQTGKPEHALAALQASERGRARSLVDMLLEGGDDIRQGVSSQLISSKRELHRRLNAKARAQVELLSGKHTEEQAAAVAKELDDLISEFDRVQAEIRKASPAYANLTQPPPPALQDIRERLLDEDTSLLEYWLGEEKSYLWIVDKMTITGHELPKRTDIESAARRLYESLTAQQPSPNESSETHRRRLAEAEGLYPSRAAALSSMLLDGAAEAGQLNRRRLLIVGDGLLNYLPFAALPAPASRSAPKPSAAQGVTAKRTDAKLLLEEYEVVSLPSITSVLLMRNDAKKRSGAPLSVLVFANPVFDPGDSRLQRAKRAQRPDAPSAAPANPPPPPVYQATRDGFDFRPLPLTLDEARSIKAAALRSTLMLGFEANRAAVSSLPPERHRIVHFATHGVLNETHPELSGIVLSLYDERGNRQDGELRLHDIYNLKLPSELVVLSACSTGLGRLVRGEGIIGLTRGFMYAGSPRVIASLWKVDDLATQQLMERFYKLMFKRGMSPAAALRQAQLEMWREQRWRAPYNWAAFVLYGEWRDIP
jgi:CHAT domain-containing protein/tetratricopeptide (TPR) repeat protein